MTTLRDKLDLVDEKMRTFKEEFVATKPENVEISIYMHFWRDEEIVAAVGFQLDGANAVASAPMGASGFNATTMSCTFESWHSELKVSPLTGQPWRGGEMNYLARTDPQAFEKGWVEEVLSTSIHDRDGDFWLSTTPFTIEDDKVRWGERSIRPTEEEKAEGVIGDGRMHGAFVRAMDEPTMLEKISELAEKDPLTEMMLNLVDDPEQRLYHCDAATVRALSEQEGVTAVMLYAEAGTLREKLIDEGMESLGLSRDH